MKVATSMLRAVTYHKSRLRDMTAFIAGRLAKMIKLIVQVLEEVLRFARREFFFCHMSAAGQLLFQRIQRLNGSVLACQDAGMWQAMQLASYKRFPLAMSPDNEAA